MQKNNEEEKMICFNQRMADMSDCATIDTSASSMWEFAGEDASGPGNDQMKCALTGLPTKALFFDRLYRAIERMHRKKDYQYSVLFINLDRFRIINESLGHAVGNEMLRAAAMRLAEGVRKIDTVTWFGRDEFIVLLDNIDNSKNVLRVVERIQSNLSLPFLIRGHEIFVSASIGIVYSSFEYETPHQMVRDAETAMYRAKAEKRISYRVFDSKMHEQAVKRLNMESDLRKAIEQKEFVLHYQPIVDLRTHDVVGLEALIRWNHPRRGVVQPMEFIPIAEDTGLIVPIGTWVLQEACYQIAEYMKEFISDGPFILGLNVSVIQLLQGDLVSETERIIKETGIDPKCLKLEITESVMMDNADSMVPLFNNLRKTGIHLVMDDFGTGYSSLSYLQQFPFDTLKIDRSFVDKLGPDNDKNTKIIQTIISLAMHLGMNVIAEGIENEVQIERLRELNCPYGQGFYFSKPLELEPVKQFHKENNKRLKFL
ncbi:bifunctional diguanylate cyclase/phosphodiesterase [Desulfobacterales bacterium HSG2]|nr:bifunctional diguanylate cyclase/phosphodiesterase [Desulfobacterales bacterium HSG2]